MDGTLSAWRTTVGAGVAIAGTNLVVLAAGRMLGADMVVARSANASLDQVGAGTVVLMSVGPALLGGVMLWLAARRGLRAWRAVGWLGLALGLATVPMPIGMVATGATTTTLASMHLVAGVIWFGAVRRAATRQHHPAPALGSA